VICVNRCSVTLFAQLKRNWNRTETKRFENSFETVLKLFCFSSVSVSFQLFGQFYLQKLLVFACRPVGISDTGPLPRFPARVRCCILCSRRHHVNHSALQTAFSCSTENTVDWSLFVFPMVQQSFTLPVETAAKCQLATFPLLIKYIGRQKENSHCSHRRIHVLKSMNRLFSFPSNSSSFLSRSLLNFPPPRDPRFCQSSCGIWSIYTSVCTASCLSYYEEFRTAFT